MHLESAQPDFDPSSATNKTKEASKWTRFNGGAWLAWTLCAIVVVFSLFGLGSGLSAPGLQANVFALADAVMNCAIGIVFGIVGAMILGRYPRHTIGWLLMVIALAYAVFVLAQNYFGLSSPASPEATLATWLVTWLSEWVWWLLIGPLLLILLLFPTGRLLSGRWRWVVVLLASLFTFFLFFATFSKTVTDTSSGKTLPNPLGIIPESVTFDALIVPWGIALVATVAACVASVFVRYRRASPVEREQIKWFLFACLIFLVVYASEGLNGSNEKNAFSVLFDAAILLIPVSIGIAILRYRLWDIDLIIRRTVVYVPLTAILAGLFAASITLTQKIFVGATGQQSDAATVLTTLIVVAAFDPIKSRLQKAVDARFKEAHDPTTEVHRVRDQARAVLQVIEPRASARHFLDAAVRAFDATGGAVLEPDGAEPQAIYQVGEWHGAAQLQVPMDRGDGQQYTIVLGARRNGTEYTNADRDLLIQALEPLAQTLQYVNRSANRASAISRDA